ncbi:MAG: NAD(P)-dependent alcohol dehydrogenase [Vicinamibacteraceae bacterium]|nr:NAD(P)-dependent alcohol dehydrogenase [Vicinamibacteraceae bacterium]
MRAWIIDTTGETPVLALVTRPDPEPGPREVVVATRAVALNHRDLLPLVPRFGAPVAAPDIPCSDAAGEVVATGRDVTRVAAGDRVVSTFAPDWLDGPFSREVARVHRDGSAPPGVLAEYVVLPEHGVMPMPLSMSVEQAATLPCAALTAWHALFEESPIEAGQTVLTIGAGGVSVFAIQMAAWAGARVIATSSRAGTLAALASFGAGTTLHTAHDEPWGDRVRELAGGTGVDHVVEVGGQGTLAQSLRAVRYGGTISLVGALARPAAVTLAPVTLHNIRLQGIVVGSRAMFERMNAAYERGLPLPAVDRVFPFDQAPDAFAYMAGGRHVGKVVIGLRSET